MEEIKCEGWSQLEVYGALEVHMISLRDAKREAEEEILIEVPDFAWGWCAASVPRFPQSLTGEKVREYQAFAQAKSAR